ncbi:hypothetical protein J1N35_019120 [Gossypium stocksii]|uniref:Uncharacterized protein n=1 Tax=Gossypium stocksii TaxID=47602 RepID=A0A9D3VSJ9_9ROSI|nr:hypothetical protein J1N35_019120 [Gossypium stocksii]
MLNYDTTESSSSSNDDNKSEHNNSIISEEINATSYNSDEENTSTEENIEIPKPMDTDNTDPYIPKPKEKDKKDPYGKRKIESDIQKDDYLRSFNKDNELVEETTRIFETIATNDVKPENPGETSTQPIPYRIDDLNKRNVAQGGIYLDLTKIPLSDYEKTIDDWAQSMTIVVNNNSSSWTKEKFLNYFVGTFQGDVLQFLRRWEESEKGKQQKE